MPRLREAMKDAASCENHGVGANSRQSRGIRMGQPGAVKPHHSMINGRQTQGTETSKYLEEEKTKVIPQVAASERGEAQTISVAMHIWGCRTATFNIKSNWNHAGKHNRRR